MLKLINLVIEKTVANQSGAMEADTISKHGSSSKIHKSRGNFLTSKKGGRHFTKNIIMAILCFFTLQLYGQTLEQQLLNGLHQTSNTGDGNANRWTKIASCDISQNLKDLGGVIEFMGSGSGTEKFFYGRIIGRFKNQDNTYRCSLILQDSNLGANNVKAIRNGGIIEIYISIPQTWTQILFRQTLKSVSGPLNVHSNQSFLPSLPSGTQTINCELGNTMQGTEPNIPFDNSSPVYGARLVYDATFNDPNQLRNIISLRNNTTNGTATTLRQSGINFSLGGQHNQNESEKSAQILLESRNTYANYPSLNFYTKNTQRMTILHDGKVGINTTTPRTQFEVNGVIRATEVRVLLSNAPDYVFDDNYELRSLEEVEQFIKQNRHLPDIPSAAEMEEDGIGLSEMNKLLLQKIEELTLYMIELKKEIDELKK